MENDQNAQKNTNVFAWSQCGQERLLDSVGVEGSAKSKKKVLLGRSLAGHKHGHKTPHARALRAQQSCHEKSKRRESQLRNFIFLNHHFCDILTVYDIAFYSAT